MTMPGRKAHGAGMQQRFVNPQWSEAVFRLGTASTPGPNLSTVMTAEATTAGTLTIPSYVNSVAGVLIVCIGAANAIGASTVASVSWNSRSLSQAGTITGGGHSTAALWYLLAADLGATSDIVITFSATVDDARACAYTVQGVLSQAPESSDDNTADVGSGSISSTIGPLTRAAVVLDSLYNIGGLDPAATASGQTEIAGAQLAGVASVITSSWATGPSPAATQHMDWSGLTAGNTTTQVLVSFATRVPDTLTQPATSSLKLGWDFSNIDSVVTVTGAGISNVTDSSGNSNSGTQTTDARRPLWGSAMINGKLAADNGNAVARHLILPATITGLTGNGQPPFHILLVCSVNTWTNATTLLSFETAGSSPRTAIRLSTSGGTRIEARLPNATPGATVILSNQTALATGTTYLVEVYSDGSGNGSIIVNEGTATTTAVTASSGESLSTRRMFHLTASTNGYIGAVYIFNAKLSAGELTDWRAFLKQRWGYV